MSSKTFTVGSSSYVKSHMQKKFNGDLEHLQMCHTTFRQLRARRAVSLFKDVPLRTIRALSPLTLYSDSALLVRNITSLNIYSALLVRNVISLNIYSALLALNWRFKELPSSLHSLEGFARLSWRASRSFLAVEGSFQPLPPSLPRSPPSPPPPPPGCLAQASLNGSALYVLPTK